jgi:hypothetical protein
MHRVLPYENCVIWQTTKRYEEGKFVAYDAFTVQSVGIFTSDEQLRRYTANERNKENHQRLKNCHVVLATSP